MANFPKDFVWGAASAAYQIEGGAAEDGRGPSIWDTFSHVPGNINRNENGDVSCDSYHRWPEDVALMQSMGLRAYRFSVSWPRVAPTGGTDWNAAGLAYYDKLVDALLAAGIEPYITLYHWDLPQALQDHGGWLNEATALAFEQYAAKLAGHFKGRVHHWFTLNELGCIVGLGYGNGVHAPGLKRSTEDQFTCWENALYAHCLAEKALHTADPANVVGMATTGRLCYPLTDVPADRDAARQLTFASPDDDWWFTHQMALDPLVLGDWQGEIGPRLKACMAAVPAHHRAAWPDGRPDVLGVNIYNALPVKMGANGPEYVERPTGYPRTALGWPVEPPSLNWGPRLLAERYNLPLYITENGLSCNDKIYRDGKVHDADRIDFLARYLKELSVGIAAGAEVKGYFHWALTDNFEWHSGYNERFGLVFIDYTTQNRLPKDSAGWYADVVKTNGSTL